MTSRHPGGSNGFGLDYHLQADHHVNPHSTLPDLGVVIINEILYVILVDREMLHGNASLRLVPGLYPFFKLDLRQTNL